MTRSAKRWRSDSPVIFINMGFFIASIHFKRRKYERMCVLVLFDWYGNVVWCWKRAIWQMVPKLGFDPLSDKSVASLGHSTLLIASEFRSYPCSWKLTKEIFQTQIHLTCISWELKRRNNKLFLTIMIERYWPTSPVCFWNMESVDLFVFFVFQSITMLHSTK